MVYRTNNQLVRKNCKLSHFRAGDAEISGSQRQKQLPGQKASGGAAAARPDPGRFWVARAFGVRLVVSFSKLPVHLGWGMQAGQPPRTLSWLDHCCRGFPSRFRGVAEPVEAGRKNMEQLPEHPSLLVFVRVYLGTLGNLLIIQQCVICLVNELWNRK